MVRVVEMEHPGHSAVPHSRDDVTDAQTKCPAYKNRAQYYRQQHAGSLQKVNPDDCLHPSPECVEQEYQYGNKHIDPERNSERPEHHELQGNAYEVQPHGRPQHLGNEEEPGSCAIGGHAKPLLQIAVYGHQVHPVEKRYQHEGDDELSGNEAEGHLHISEARDRHHSRDGDVCNP